MQDLHENHVLVIVASCKNITIIIIIKIIILRPAGQDITLLWKSADAF